MISLHRPDLRVALGTHGRLRQLAGFSSAAAAATAPTTRRPVHLPNIAHHGRGEDFILSSSRALGGTAAKLTDPTSPAFSYDRHDRHDSNIHPTSFHQRQQRLSTQQNQTPPPFTSEQRSTPSPSPHQRPLHRAPRFLATPSPKPVEAPPAEQPRPRVAVTLGPQGKYVLTGQQHWQPGQHQQAPRQQTQSRARRQPRRKLSQDWTSDEDDEDDEHPARAPSQYHRQPTPSHGPAPEEPHPSLRISKRTHSAILFALEETLRGPQPLSRDLVEELAPMSDLLGGSGVATANGNGVSSRTATSRAPAGSPSGIRGPRMIMQERQAREARQREEKERERLDREHAEAEALLLEETQRREAERRAGAGAGGISTTAGAGGLPTDVNTGRRAGSNAATTGRIPTDTSTLGGDGVGGVSRHGRASSAAAQPAQTTAPTAGTSKAQSQAPGSDPATAVGRSRNSFPHAFERWETLSAHWEGLTSFWIRRLQQNSEEINQDPIAQQLSRQVTDLSSAGANLFHAVVELQRLRASSERKFQRWFFDTRTELERNQEVTAMLEAALEEERRTKADAVREALENAQGSSKVQKQLSEMRKELQISKEEARRAWEELGRREQEERDRTASLQLGQPTIVGGVQVVPMTQGVSRHNSQRDPQAYNPGDPSDYARGQAPRPEYTQAPAVQPVTSAGGPPYSQQQGQAIHHQGSYGSEGTYSEGEYTIDSQGNFVRDSHGDRIPFRAPAWDASSDAGIEDFETPASQPGGPHGTGVGTPQQQHQQSYSSAPDYTGSGYTTPTWETMPRHHHPTRLSDVIEEEDERSRTSASHSQISRG